jgi:hypothetical protein
LSAAHPRVFQKYLVLSDDILNPNPPFKLKVFFGAEMKNHEEMSQNPGFRRISTHASLPCWCFNTDVGDGHFN